MSSHASDAAEVAEQARVDEQIEVSGVPPRWIVKLGDDQDIAEVPEYLAGLEGVTVVRVKHLEGCVHIMASPSAVDVLRDEGYNIE